MIITIDTEKPLDLAAAYALRELIEHWHPSFPVGHKTVNVEGMVQVEIPDLSDDQPEVETLPSPLKVPDADPIALAVSKAMELAADQRRDEIKTALAKVGGDKVSNLTPEQARGFLAEFE